MKNLNPYVLLIFAILGSVAFCADESAELKKLEGTWKIESMIMDGMKLPGNNFSHWTVVIVGDKYKISVQGPASQESESKMKIDSSTNPKHMDMTLTKPGSNEEPGIYKLDGDTLTISWSQGPGATRPTSFEYQKEKDNSVFVMRRVKGTQVLIDEAVKRPIEPKTAQTPLVDAENPATLSRRLDAAEALCKKGQYAEAEKEYRAVLTIRELALGTEHLDVYRSCQLLSICLMDQGKLNEALLFAQRAEAGFNKVLGAEHMDTTIAKFGRALIEEGLKKANAPKTPSTAAGYGEDPATLTIRMDAANKLYQKHQFAEAEKEYRAVLNIRKRVLGEEHLDTLSTWNNLAISLGEQGKHSEEEQEHRALLKVRERVLGAEHPDTLGSRYNLANALYCRGKYAEAEQEHREALKVRTRVLGAEHPDVFRSCYVLVFILEAQGKLREALEFAQRAETGRNNLLGAEDPDSKYARAAREHIEAKLKNAK